MICVISEKDDLKSKKNEKKDKKESGGENKSENGASKEVKEEKILEDLPGDDKNNYLYDRFVVNPTNDDCIDLKSISDTFISDKELEKIRNEKIQIKVSPVERVTGCCHVSKETKDKIENIDENRTARSKLLQEFDSLSKEMKLLLIENILKK